MKKSKKFVLAWLVLLAITMVLLPLAGCKNDTVPPEVEKQEQGDGGGSETDKNNTAAKLVSISVTPPARTVYSVGQSFAPTGMVVTATYEGGEKREVTGWETDFNTVANKKGLGKIVTVSYKEGETPKITTFTITVFPEEVKVLTNYTSSHAPEGEWTYVEFGDWPQSEAPGVNPTQVTLQSENLFKDKYYFDANGEYVKEGDNYYKVEPIVWRVLTTNYEVPEGGTGGEVLLLAEKILTGGIMWAGSTNNYRDSYIRRWLNGNNWTGGTSDYGGGAGFLQTAFTESDWELIADTTVDNIAHSTTDKIFLLSEEEATNSEYGFAASSNGDSTRIRVTTDYAKATGAEQSSYGGWWWLRWPHFYIEDDSSVIYNYGYAYNNDRLVDYSSGGVVPALSISLQ